MKSSTPLVHIDAAIAVRYPEGAENAGDLSKAVSNARLSYCVCYQDETRFPESGWLEGSVEDLADLVRLVSVPQRAVDEAADVLEKGIDRAAAVLGQLAESRPDVVTSVAGLLGMSEGLQTYRMAGAIVANAMVFHERLAGLHGVKPLSQLCSTSVANPEVEHPRRLDGDPQGQLLADLLELPGTSSSSFRRLRPPSFCPT